MLLPSFVPGSANPKLGSKRAVSAPTRRIILGLLCAVLCVFFWMQYTIFTSNFGTLDAAVERSKQSPTAIMQENNPTEKLKDDKHLRSVPQQEREKPSFGFDALDLPSIAPKGQQQRLPEIAKTSAPQTPAPPAVAASPEDQGKRQQAVKDAMKFAWKNYEEIAFGADEVDPKYGLRLENVWGGIACSLVDGMDTLWIMGLKEEFARARDYVANSLSFDHLGKDHKKISVFETIIREVGGLLSAFDLSGDSVFKDKAKELMDLLTPAFSEKEGVFYTLFNPHTKERSFASWSGYK